MSEARRKKRILQRANIKHNPALRKLVIEAVTFLEKTGSDNWEQSEYYLRGCETRWYAYCAENNMANTEAFMLNVLRYTV